MRFGQNLSVYIIPEWKQCYIDYQNLKIFVVIIKALVQNVQTLQAVTRQSVPQIENVGMQSNTIIINEIEYQRNSNEDNKSFKIIKQALMVKLQAIDGIFKQAFKLQIQMAQLFYQMKTLQLNEKFVNTQQIGLRQFDKDQLPTFLMLIEYIYVQAKYLDQMTGMNLQGQRKILKKHKKVSSKLVQTPVSNHRKINRLKGINQNFLDDIQNYYVRRNTLQQQTKDRRQFLRNTATRAQTTSLDACLLGLWIGISLSLLILLIVIILVKNLNLEKNSTFQRDFPTWRGIAIFIFYVWILGFDTYMYEHYKITHRLIFSFNDHHYSRAVNIFKIAGLHTTVFLVLFLMYVMDLAKLYDFNHFTAEYFALISWGVFILSLFIPLPFFNHKGRIYAFKLVFQSILSPCRGVTFPVIWMTDQVVSMVTPLKDFAYTICYYTEMNFSSSDNPCRDDSRIQVVLIVAVSALSYRIVQCLRQGYDHGSYFGTPFFINTLKYASSLITAVLAFQYRLGEKNMLAIWLIFAAISTIFSYAWDIKMDWGLLQKNDRNLFLRKYLNFQPRRNYYIIILSNLIMRLSWVFTLSPGIISIFGNTQIFILVTGMIQILRRGIWNLLRVQKQHLVNCGDFKAVPDTTKIQNKLTRAQDSSELHIMVLGFLKKFQNNRFLLQKQFLALIRQKIAVKQEFTKKYNSLFQQQQLKQIELLMQQVLRTNPKLLKRLKQQKKNKKKKNKRKENEEKDKKRTKEKQNKMNEQKHTNSESD